MSDQVQNADLANAEAAAALAKRVLRGHDVSDEQLLAEINEAIRTAPSSAQFASADLDVARWKGRVTTLLDMWKPPSGSLPFKLALNNLNASFLAHTAYPEAMSVLFEAQHSLKIRGGARGSVAVGKGNVFDYFSAVKKYIEQAQADLFVVDPYLDAEFVERYLPYVRSGVQVRMLTSNNKITSLLPAVDAFVAQTRMPIAVRERNDLHGRFLLIDGHLGYQSDPSYKDGAKNADAVVLEIVDVLPEVISKFETAWSKAAIAR